MGKGKKKRGGFGDRVGAWAGGALRQNLNISQQARPQMGKEWEAARRERECERDERGGVKQEMGHQSFFFLFSKSSSGHGRARIPRKVSHLNVNSLRQFRPTGSENPATQL